MAQMFGNNLTFPFMDLELYRFLKELPVNLKCKGDNVWKIARGQFVSKYLLKHHYKPLLPEAITAKRSKEDLRLCRCSFVMRCGVLI